MLTILPRWRGGEVGKPGRWQPGKNPEFRWPAVGRSPFRARAAHLLRRGVFGWPPRSRLTILRHDLCVI